MEPFFHALLLQLSEPSYALTLLFTVALLAATLLPLGSEPVLLALITLQPDVVWPALGVATLGNTLGGMVGWWMGRGAQTWLARRVDMAQSPGYARALPWLRRLGPVACLGAWLPVVGDPLCVLAGYLRLPLLPCAAYMAIGKGLRYLAVVFGWQWLLALWA
jgi:membrane protein YqaA with SNARE-associated domain